MDAVIEGRVWVFGDSVDTDNMYPGFAMKLPIEEAAGHVFYDLRPGWTEQVAEGDIVVAGKNFGIGSSRPVALLFRQLGVAALVADEFNSLFLRNSINFGLPAIQIPGVSEALHDEDRVRLDIRRATIERIGDGKRLQGAPLPDFVLDILIQGGLLPKLAAEGYLPTTATR
ncbi:MAG TPA: 3-isopropylmalate dehydratase [Solirubrobacteraceae bacterium]|jgi:3-isopropylmalate/(R)-2-methylmalate dehydratase small subunit